MLNCSKVAECGFREAEKRTCVVPTFIYEEGSPRIFLIPGFKKKKEERVQFSF